MQKTNKGKYYLGIDVGGSHFAMGIVDTMKMRLCPDTVKRYPVDSKISAQEISGHLLKAIRQCIAKFGKPVIGVGISIPGPFDYEHGICHISGLNKYDALFGVDLKLFLKSNLHGIVGSVDEVAFTNDADSFVLGEAYANNLINGRVIGVTLGTGIGSGFVINGKIITDGEGMPKNGNIYNLPFRDKRVEDWISTQWFLDRFIALFGSKANNVKEIAEKAEKEQKAKEIFEAYGQSLGQVLSPILESFQPSSLIIGGSISKSYHLFKEAFESCFPQPPNIHLTKGTAHAAILGAVIQLTKKQDTLNKKRNTEQYVMPVNVGESKPNSGYNIYPSFEISKGTISKGVASLIDEFPKTGSLIIDGYMGAYWDNFMEMLSNELRERDINHIVRSVEAAYKDADSIENMIGPFLGGDDPVFGKIFPGNLKDFFDSDRLGSIRPEEGTLNILYGPGATLAGWDGEVIYMDMPKNEIQFRARAGQVPNLGNVYTKDRKQQYKRMYFIDWPVLNRHKQELLGKVDYFVDAQFGDEISWTTGDTLRQGLEEMSHHAFRARPWFEPGIWGGDWMKTKFSGLPQDVPNYAWSFELISPENGIVLSKKGVRLEVSFDLLMYHNSEAVLGGAAAVFGTDFPIRFDYLDTVNGQNLSLQCHPTLEYIQDNFGEKFTQDETYYILDAEPGAKVYLGFQEGVTKDNFRKALVKSHSQAEPMPVEDYIQIHPAKKHDLFLIPNGTVHCSGVGNQVLEISSTPYIFTFKMYDWMRMDLDGKPRPLNIDRGVANLNMDCQGDIVAKEYISKQETIKTGKDGRVVKLNTHAKHFYEIHRFEFVREISVEMNNQCHILNLVEGNKIQVVTNDRTMDIHYAETFVVPAAVGAYKIRNLGGEEAKVIQSNVKPEFCKIGF